MSKKKLITPLLIVSFLVPQITFASWWNPLSWGWFKKKEAAPIAMQTIPVSTSTDQVATPPATSPSVTISTLVDFNNTVGVTDSVDPNRGGHYNSQPAISGTAPLTLRVKVPSGNDASLVYGDGTDSSILKQGQFSRETGYSVAGQVLEHTYTKPGMYLLKYFTLMPSGLRGDVIINVKESSSVVKESAKVSASTSGSDSVMAYTNQTHGYTMNYPKNWLVEPETQELRKPNKLLSIVGMTSPDKTKKVSVIVNENEWMLRMEAPTKENITIDGTEQVAYIFPRGYECGGQKGDCSFFVIPIRHGNVWYELHGIGDAKSVTNTYKDIFSSFKFTK